MKKLLFLVLSFFLTLSSFAQISSQTFHQIYISNQYTYSNMWYNDYTEKWEFGTTSDNVYTRAIWEFTLNENGGGSIISGKIFYTVKSWELRITKDGNKVVFLTAYNHTLNREMSIIASAPDGKFFMAVYDYENLLSYYFSE